ncbi:hypothetical protein Patl1_27847 [Pistacia atlantica]|uniref:Uncharacterized protein n=1 Tax=Pistacia atlantica TaxID=434234 RepID=A0ACC1BHF6_9ROSI|nr:hypothetical protein Patl1_27847 [Pistacia atlantica]
MVREEVQLNAAKRAYRSAKAEGNRQEEARWANLIGDMLKNRGEYVEALKWFRIDYEVSIKYLPEKQLLPTCQSLGEVYLRLEYFKDALIYQKKHLELAKDTGDLVEQQRASTQLGRTYHEMFLRSEDDHYSVRNAKKYFKSAMKLAQTLKESPPSNRSSFLKENIDAHNNIGMLEMDLDNLESAKKFLTRGLEICDEEEVSEDDDGRSRIHHNLGNVYMELRMWDKSREHIEKDIIICKRIGHCQGEAKGYINLGELHYRVQKYEEAILCYHKALNLAKSMEDEDSLVSQIDQNIETVKKAMKVMDELKNEEQNLKKLTRNMVSAEGTSGERKCLLQQNASVDRLIEKSSMIFAWLKHREFAKRKKRIASELCDKEKLSDSFLVIGESYHKLRKFKKAIKWYTKSWEIYKSIGNMEGQALAKINIGDVLDCDGDWAGALDAFEEGYRIAVEANLPSVQLSALENMHYSHMIRFDNVEEARRLQLAIDKLKDSETTNLEAQEVAGDICSETDTEGNDHLSDGRSSASCSPKMSKAGSGQSKSLAGVEEFKDDVPLISILQSSKRSAKMRTAYVQKQNVTKKPTEASPKSLSKLTDSQQTGVGRKRVRVVLSDDEGEMHDDVECMKGRFHKNLVEDIATSDEIKNKSGPGSPCIFQDVTAATSKCANNSGNCINVEESTCSYKYMSPKPATPNANAIRCSAEVPLESNFATSVSKDDIDVSRNILHKHRPSNSKLHNPDDDNDQCITFKVDNDLIHLEARSLIDGDNFNFESLKVELACLYYLQLPIEKRSKAKQVHDTGLLPIIQHIKCDGKALESLEAFETLKDHLGKHLVEVLIDGWVQKRLMKLYIDCCKEISEAPNMKLLKKLYISEVEDEVIVSECELQDISITPLLNALHTHKAVAMLDLSHNLLGNGTMEKLQQFFSSSGQKYGDLTLDLHCNRFGPTALFQICECPVLFTRLGVLNLSGNRLTDACGSYLSTILENCKALYSLNIEHCSITSRTIQKVADALSAESILAQLCIGNNNPVTGNAIINLLSKLALLKSFSELNLNGLKLSKPVVNSLCQLASTSCLTNLMLRSTGIGTDDALQLTESLLSGAQESLKLDLSYCGITSTFIHKLNVDVGLVHSILELNLGGNPIKQEGGRALASLIMNPQCCLKVLVLNKCQLGLAGVLQLIQALAENVTVEELNLADNAELDKQLALRYDSTENLNPEVLQPKLNTSELSVKRCVSMDADPDIQGSCQMNTDYNNLEVADSEDLDDENRVENAASAFDDSCTSPCQKNSSLECQFVQELSTAISMAKQLQQLDLSNNGFSTQAAETLYSAWSSRLGVASAWKHIKNQTIHLSVEENKCCRVKPCCRKELT